ncbi:MAG: hypothetical protein GC159_23230 [Phycisphaera sp.]|nr:hypothetical protein [Phycisphaera sp.]
MLTRDSRHFLINALRHPAATGAVAPSSARLSRLLIKDIDLSNGGAIVELGPGTGPVTRQIAETIADPSNYLGVERNPRFASLLNERYPSLRVINGSAEHTAQYLRDAGLNQLTAIVSGLPFASLPPAVQDGVIRMLDELMTPGVVFRTFQYVHSWPLPTAIRFRHRMNELFGRCEVYGPVIRNIPPALVFSWQRQ